jgi:hypothetical protein
MPRVWPFFIQNQQKKNAHEHGDTGHDQRQHQQGVVYHGGQPPEQEGGGVLFGHGRESTTGERINEL